VSKYRDAHKLAHFGIDIVHDLSHRFQYNTSYSRKGRPRVLSLVEVIRKNDVVPEIPELVL